MIRSLLNLLIFMSAIFSGVVLLSLALIRVGVDHVAAIS
jgi:hypothetical protein